jgi:hypothetical protein
MQILKRCRYNHLAPKKMPRTKAIDEKNNNGNIMATSEAEFPNPLCGAGPLRLSEE